MQKQIKLTPSEAEEQITVIAWADYVQHQYPALRWLYHCPNGEYRSKATAKRLKAMGVKPGVPDLILPVPMHGYTGLVIELKMGKNTPSPDQRRWLEHFASIGWKTAVHYSCDAAISEIEEYLDIPKGLYKVGKALIKT
jgi:hypothetical protein